ncbi:hypothetical protein NKJ26_22720 [Mesorhizobium sp. M0152]|uniref:hypothetical protein n=1 Tax=Mesorhizobium sp. M0152 TaxID=2956898 RepID=UPI003335013B
MDQRKRLAGFTSGPPDLRRQTCEPRRHRFPFGDGERCRRDGTVAGGHILHDKPAFWASDSYAPAMLRTPVTMPLDSADRSRIASRASGGRIIVDRAYLVSAADYRSAA